MNSTQQIKIGALLSYISLGVNIITGLLYTPWMIRTIGQADYGLYTLAMSVITLFVFDFGLSSAITRFLAKYLAEGKQDKANNCLGLVYKLYLYFDTFIFVVLTVFYFFIPQIYQELTPEEIDKFKVVYAISAIFAVISFPFIPVNGVLSANEKFVQLKLCEVINKIIIIGAMSVCLLMGYGLYALVLVNVVAGVLTILLKLWCIRKYTRTNISWGYKDKEQFKEIISFSGWTSVGSLAHRLIFTIAPTILGFFCGSISISIFGIANVIEGYVFYFASALSGMFLPKISNIIAKGDGNVLPLMIKIGRLQLMIVALIIFGFIILGKDFLQLWVGDGFSQSYVCTVLLIIPSLVQLPQEIGMQTIVAKNKVKEQAYVFSLMGLVNIILALLLTWKYDVIGICMAICISYFLRTAGLDFIFKRRLDIDIKKFFKESFGKMLPALLGAFIVGMGVNYLLPEVSWPNFMFKGLIFVVIYIVFIYFVTNQNERDLFIMPIKRLIFHRNK